MQNRFGLKDLLLMVLVAVAIVFTYLNMVQIDRLWTRSEDTLNRAKQIEGQMGRVDTTLSQVSDQVASTASQLSALREQVDGVSRAISAGVRIQSEGAGSARAGAPAASAPTAEMSDDSWARPGVPILRQPPRAFVNDPSTKPGFQSGGEMTEIWEAQTKTLTPFISTDVYSRRVQELVLESLADYHPVTLQLQGQLAEAWQVDPAGRWLRARLRPNMRFSDGTPVTAEDIRWTYHEYIMNEQIDAERTRSIYRGSIKRVVVIDERTVEFEFEDVLFSNISNALGMFVLPKHFYSRFDAAQINRASGLLMGSGPFRLRNLNPDRQWAPPADIVIERNEQHNGPRPALAAIRYRAVNEEIGRLNSFAKGDAQIITPSAPQFVSKSEDPEWQGWARFLKWTNMRSGYSFIAWNCGERNGKLTPFHDRRVRLAMTHALDRERMIRDIFRNVGVVAKGNQPLNAPGANPNIQPWPYDPAKARELLRQAGWEDRNGDGFLDDQLGNQFRFEFFYPSGSEIGDRVARFIRDSFAEIGIRADLKPVEWSVYQDVLKTRDFDACTLGWGSSAPESDPRQIFHSESIKNQGDNFAQWANAEADRLIELGRRELDDQKRARIWQELERVLHEEQPYTFLRVPPWVRFVRVELGNVEMYPKGLEPVEYFRGASVPMRGQ
jgi:peptide/nickel transport system substrate-binding protein